MKEVIPFSLSSLTYYWFCWDLFNYRSFLNPWLIYYTIKRTLKPKTKVLKSSSVRPFAQRLVCDRSRQRES